MDNPFVTKGYAEQIAEQGHFRSVSIDIEQEIAPFIDFARLYRAVPSHFIRTFAKKLCPSRSKP